MLITVQFSANTYGDVRNLIRDYLAEPVQLSRPLDAPAPGAVAQLTSDPVQAPARAETITETEPKKRGRKPKGETPASSAPPDVLGAGEQPAFKFEDVYAKLQQVATTKGLAAVIKLCREDYKVESIKSLKPEQYAEFIASCDLALGGAHPVFEPNEPNEEDEE